MNTSALIKLLIALFVVFINCGSASGQTVKERFEAAAEKINGITYYAFLSFINYNSPPSELVKNLFGDDWAQVQQVTTLSPTLEELEILMAHPNARVRTLVMLAAYRLESRKAFLLIHHGIGDIEITIPNTELEYDSSERKLFVNASKKEKIIRTFKEVTVSEISKMILGRIGYHNYGIDDPEEEKRKFEAWTKSHLFNPQWIGWFDYLRVCAQRGDAINKDKPSPQILKLRATINQLEPPLREWVILYFSSSDLIKEEDVATSLKSLGEEKLLTYLEKGNRIGLDAPVEHNISKGGTKAAILSHSKLVFTPKSAKRLSSLYFYIAAADADPNRATFFMQKSLITKWTGKDNSWAKGLAAAVILDHQGDKEIGTILDLLYQNYTADQFDGFENFSIEAIRREPKQWKNTFIAIAKHPKYKGLSPTDVKHLDKAVAHLSGAKVQKDEDKAIPSRKMKIIIK